MDRWIRDGVGAGRGVEGMQVHPFVRVGSVPEMVCTTGACGIPWEYVRLGCTHLASTLVVGLLGIDGPRGES